MTKQSACPKGYAPVSQGEIQIGDLLWDESDGWEPAHALDIGAPVAAFKFVARKQPPVTTTHP